MLDAYDNQDVPFDRVVDALQPERDLARHPLFQHAIVLQNASPIAFDLPGDQWETPPLKERAGLDLLLELVEVGPGLSAELTFDSALFDAATVERMAGHLQVLLAGIVEDPGRPVLRLPLLDEAERHQVLVEWNDTACPFPDGVCMSSFEDQVRRSPDAVAVVFGESSLTYAELNARANRLAHWLRELGVGPEVMVGLAVERGLDLIAGVLGILKAGGAYVPLDVEFPAAEAGLHAGGHRGAGRGG